MSCWFFLAVAATSSTKGRRKRCNQTNLQLASLEVSEPTHGTVNDNRHELAHSVRLVARGGGYSVVSGGHVAVLKPLLLGALLAGLFHPLYRWITRLMGGRPSLGAAITLLVLLVLGLGPVSAFLGIVLQQALTMSNQAIPWLNQHLGAATTFNVHDWVVQRFPALAKYVPSQEQLLEQVGTAAKTAGMFLVSFAAGMTATTAAFLLNLFVMLYAMFFFFRDGHKILERIFYYTPLSDEDETRMLTQFASITRATVKGTLVIGVIQGALAGIAFWVAGIEGAALWGTIMTILSIIPRDRRRPGVGAGSYHSICNGAVSNGNLAGSVVRRRGRHCR